MNKRTIALGSIGAILGLAVLGNALPDEDPVESPAPSPAVATASPSPSSAPATPSAPNAAKWAAVQSCEELNSVFMTDTPNMDPERRLQVMATTQLAAMEKRCTWAEDLAEAETWGTFDDKARAEYVADLAKTADLMK